MSWWSWLPEVGKAFVISFLLFSVTELLLLSALCFRWFRIRCTLPLIRSCKCWAVSCGLRRWNWRHQAQVMGLAALGIPASMLTSTTSKENEKFIFKALEKGEGDLKILYVTPEKISKSKRFMSKLEKCHHAGRLSLIAIDVSAWFYLNIQVSRI